MNMKHVFVALAATALLGASSAVAQVNPYGSTGKGKMYGLDVESLAPGGIVVVMDFSGSMSGETGGKAERGLMGRVERGVGRAIGGRVGREISDELRERRQKAKEAIREVSSGIEGLPADQSFNLITFESTPEPWRDELVLADEENKEDAEDFLEDLEPSGGTAMIPALELAFSMRPQYVILVSDGEAGEGTTAVLDAVAELNEDGLVTIHTIGIGEDHDEELMSGLAEDHGGEYHTRGAGPI